MNSIKRIIILDDHQLFADSFSLILEKYITFEHIHLFNATDEFERFLRLLGREEVYIFLDYYLQDKNGLSVLTEIKRVNKEARIIFLSSTTSPNVIHNMTMAKPHGILSKFCDFSTVTECLMRIQEKSFYIDAHSQKFLNRLEIKPPNFTSKELELLRHFANGLNIADTAEKLFLSTHTIVAHRRKMMAKANCNSIGQLIKYVQDRELI